MLATKSYLNLAYQDNAVKISKIISFNLIPKMIVDTNIWYNKQVPTKLTSLLKLTVNWNLSYYYTNRSEYDGFPYQDKSC